MAGRVNRRVAIGIGVAAVAAAAAGPVSGLVSLASRDGASAEPGSGRPIADVIDVVSRHFRISRAEILGPSRTRSIVQARQTGMYLAHKLSGKSLPEIGRCFGGRDHVTVLHAARKIEGRMLSDAGVRSEIERLTLALRRMPAIQVVGAQRARA